MEADEEKTTKKTAKSGIGRVQVSHVALWMAAGAVNLLLGRVFVSITPHLDL